jgi:hypothetical protein
MERLEAGAAMLSETRIAVQLMQQELRELAGEIEPVSIRTTERGP